MIVNFWILLSIIAVILLAIFWRTRNAVWSGLTIDYYGFHSSHFLCF